MGIFKILRAALLSRLCAPLVNRARPLAATPPEHDPASIGVGACGAVPPIAR